MFKAFVAASSFALLASGGSALAAWPQKPVRIVVPYQAECARHIADRRIDVDRLFTHRWRLEQAEEAYRLFDTQTSGKGVILPS